MHPTAIQKWEADIKEAEACQCQSIEVMDIYAAKLEEPLEHEVLVENPEIQALTRWMDLAYIYV